MFVAAADTITVSPAILTLVIIGAVGQFGFNAFVAVMLNRINKRDRTEERTEDEIHTLTTKLVDERFRAMSHEVNNHVNAFGLTLDSLVERIRAGEQDLDGLGERDQKIELAVAAKLDQLKDWIRDTTATSRDLEKHEQSMGARLGKAEERMTKELGELGRTVAVLAERVGTGKRGA